MSSPKGEEEAGHVHCAAVTLQAPGTGWHCKLQAPRKGTGESVHCSSGGPESVLNTRGGWLTTACTPARDLTPLRPQVPAQT